MDSNNLYPPIYPKFKENKDCAFPERSNCNYDKNNLRCKFMKYNNSKSIFDPTRWECTYQKEVNGKQIKEKVKEEKK